MRRRLLLLNLDAEEELAAARRGAGYGAPRRGTLEAVARARARLVERVPKDLLLWLPGEPVPPGLERAAAWCPTPGARAALDAAGLGPLAADAPAPPVEALAAANDRATFAHLASLPGSAVARDLGALEAHVASAPTGVTLRLRRGLSAAGRGARFVTAGPLAAGDRAWARASLARGAVTVDPRVELVRELALHAWLGAEGGVRRGEACVQDVDGHGQWRATRRARPGELAPRVAGELAAALEAALAGLNALGYSGPVGVDAFEWRAADGEVRLHAPSEVNARYTMGWWVGLGDVAAAPHP